MPGNDKKDIGPSLGDIFRGVDNGTSKIILYRELEEIAKASRGKEDRASQVVRENLKKEAERINESGK